MPPKKTHHTAAAAHASAVAATAWRVRQEEAEPIIIASDSEPEIEPVVEPPIAIEVIEIDNDESDCGYEGEWNIGGNLRMREGLRRRTKTHTRFWTKFSRRSMPQDRRLRHHCTGS